MHLAAIFAGNDILKIHHFTESEIYRRLNIFLYSFNVKSVFNKQKIHAAP